MPLLLSFVYLEYLGHGYDTYESSAYQHHHAFLFLVEEMASVYTTSYDIFEKLTENTRRP